MARNRKIYDFDIPKLLGGGLIAIRMLGVDESDEIGEQAAKMGGEDIVLVSSLHLKYSVQRSLMQVGAMKVSKDLSGEDLYRRMEPKIRELALSCWRVVHHVTDAEVKEVLGSMRLRQPE
jgi:hypothetical protein